MLQSPSQIPFINNLDPRGSLSACELTKLTGHTFERFFVIANVIGGTRGGHAHKFTHQVICCLSGLFTLSLEFRGSSYTFVLDVHSSPIFIPALSWVDMTNISEDCIILVLSTDEYNINNSIRTYDEYRSFIASSSS